MLHFQVTPGVQVYVNMRSNTVLGLPSAREDLKSS